MTEGKLNMAKHFVYHFYAELSDYEPKIWRRFQINGEKTMAELAYTVMIMFEMQASHLFAINRNAVEELVRGLHEDYPEVDIKGYIDKNRELPFFKNRRYEVVHENIDICLDEDEKLEEANKTTLNRELSTPQTELFLSYDFGDGWEVKLVLEKIEKEEISLTLLPRVLEGEGFGIIEDVGGTDGLAHLATILQDPTDSEYEDIVNWLDSSTLNLETFDIEDMNFRLKKLIRIYKDSYEFQLPPTEKSIDLLSRAYLNKGSRGY